MKSLKKLKTNCIIEKVEGFSVKTGKPYVAYRLHFVDLDVWPIFIDTYNRNGYKLTAYVDMLGDPPSSNVE